MTEFYGATLDDDGYPTEEFLDHIKNWHFSRGLHNLLDFAMGGHIYDTCWDKTPKGDGKTEWHVSTGGWSGNESIIGALMENQIFWAMCWVQSRRGGHYIFETKENA